MKVYVLITPDCSIGVYDDLERAYNIAADHCQSFDGHMQLCYESYKDNDLHCCCYFNAIKKLFDEGHAYVIIRDIEQNTYCEIHEHILNS